MRRRVGGSGAVRSWGEEAQTQWAMPPMGERTGSTELPIKERQADKAICIRVEMEQRNAQRYDMPKHSLEIIRDPPGPAVWCVRIDNTHKAAGIRRREYGITSESASGSLRQVSRGKRNVEIDGIPSP